MKITINFDERTLEPLVQEHLETGMGVQDYIKRAVDYFNLMRKAEQSGNLCGYGDKSRFKSYNTEVSPTRYLTHDYE
jgi:hypothetical protein